MSEAKLLSGVLAGIYDAAVDPTLWPAVLGQISQFVGGSAASLFAKNAVTRDGVVFHDDGAIPAEWVDRYARESVHYDPSTTRQFVAAVGASLGTVDVMPYAEFADSRFFAEWAKPAGLVDSLTAVLDKDGAEASMLTVFRADDDGLSDFAMRRRMDLVVPHVQRAVRIAGTMVSEGLHGAALEDTIDGLAAGIFLLDRRGAPVHANAAAAAMLAQGDVVTLADEQLAPADRHAEPAFRAAVALPEAGCESTRTLPLRDREGSLYVAHVLPLRSDRRRLAGLPNAEIAVFIRSAAPGQVSAPEVLAQAYGLTPGELRVLLAIVEIGGSPEVADALGIAETTVKFHLRQLFEKTGTHRQADLVKLVGGFTNPLIS